MPLLCTGPASISAVYLATFARQEQRDAKLGIWSFPSPEQPQALCTGLIPSQSIPKLPVGQEALEVVSVAGEHEEHHHLSLLLPLLPLCLPWHLTLQKDSLLSRGELALSPFLLLLPRLRLWNHLKKKKRFLCLFAPGRVWRHNLTLTGAL